MAKFLMVPGTYAAGDNIPLLDTSLTCRYIYHEGGSPIVQVKGSGCPHRPFRYLLGATATMTALATTAEQMALTVDGVRIGGGLLSIDSAAAGEINTASVINEIGAGSSARIAIVAVTALQITDGVLIINKED